MHGINHVSAIHTNLPLNESVITSSPIIRLPETFDVRLHMSFQQPENFDFFQKIKDHIVIRNPALKDLPLIHVIKSTANVLLKNNTTCTEEEFIHFVNETVKVGQTAKATFTSFKQNSYYTRMDDQQQLHFYTIDDILGQGAIGRVYSCLNVISGKSDTVYKSLQNDTDTFAYQLKYEYDILNEIHKDGHVTGIQRAPYAVFYFNLEHIDSPKGYLAPKYDFDLKSNKFLGNWSVDQKIRGYQSLVEGLLFLHNKGIVHGDIKADNCCSDKGELQLADFGGARDVTEISAQQALGTHTDDYLAAGDKRKYKHLEVAYRLNQFINRYEKGKITFNLQDSKALNLLLENYTLSDQETRHIRLTIALILEKNKNNPDFSFSDQLAYQTKFKKEIEELQINSTTEDQLKKDLSFILRYQVDEDQLSVEARQLCKSQDVFALGKVMLEGLAKVRQAQKTTIPHLLEKVSKDPELAKVNPELINLLQAMLQEDPANRISLKKAEKEYQIILKKLEAENFKKELNAVKIESKTAFSGELNQRSTESYQDLNEAKLDVDQTFITEELKKQQTIQEDL